MGTGNVLIWFNSLIFPVFPAGGEQWPNPRGSTGFTAVVREWEIPAWSRQNLLQTEKSPKDFQIPKDEEEFPTSHLLISFSKPFLGISSWKTSHGWRKSQFSLTRHGIFRTSHQENPIRKFSFPKETGPGRNWEEGIFHPSFFPLGLSLSRPFFQAPPLVLEQREWSRCGIRNKPGISGSGSRLE